MKFIAICIAMGCLSAQVIGGEAVKPGDPAPDVTATDEAGNKVALSSFKDKEGVVIFFFPKAFTGG
jgi:peroxiredoxin